MAVVWRAVGAACTWLCQKAQSGTIPLTVGDTPTMRSAMLPSPISADAPSEGANMRRLEFDKTARNFLVAVRIIEGKRRGDVDTQVRARAGCRLGGIRRDGVRRRGYQRLEDPSAKGFYAGGTVDP